ncbi:MAG TPA: ABC transporter ATP-binding protein [Acidimicrobiales bacterium]|nr:ABC transporter ATP-binding protein [Acidimicrobiales bacterium]
MSGESTAPLFRVENLSVRFGGVKAVDDVSFDLEPGTILGVIGPNGAGKTTVFDAISGFVQASGKVWLGDRNIAGLSPERRSKAGLGRSFQDARLFPSLTVSECLAVAFERHIRTEGVVSTALRLPWVMRSERKVKGRVEELIGLMGLGAFRDKFVSELSTGSRRIVDLAVIMAHDPSVLLLDEPSSGIAQRETEALGPLLLRIREQTGCSLIVIEHDMPLITSISDEILALETGSVLTRGEPEEVLNDPRLVAAYLGTDQAVVERSGTRSAPARKSGTRPKSRQAKPSDARPRTAAKKASGSARTTATKSTSRSGSTTRSTTRSSARSASSPSSSSSTSSKAGAKAAGSTRRSSAAKSSSSTRSAGARKTSASSSSTTGTTRRRSAAGSSNGSSNGSSKASSNGSSAKRTSASKAAANGKAAGTTPRRRGTRAETSSPSS